MNSKKRVVAVMLVVGVIAAVLIWKLSGDASETRRPSAAHGKAVVADGVRRDAAARPDPRNQPRGSIAGTIADEDRAAVAGARVCATALSRHLSPELAREPSCTTADAQGRYKLAHLLVAQYVVAASAKAYIPGAHHPGGDREKTQFWLAAGEQKTGIDLVLHKGGVEITGTVSDLTGGPIAKALVTSRAGGWWNRVASPPVETDEHGAFTMWVLPGEVNVFANADGYASGSDQGSAPGTFEILLTPESSLAGKVIDAASGQPVAGVRVSAAESTEWGWDREHGGDITDEQGAFRITRLEPGRYVASAKSEHGYGRSDGSTLLGLGQHVDGVVVKLHPAYRVSGKVLLPDKTTCQEPVLGLSEPRSQRSFGGAREPDGSIVVEGVLPGTYEVEVGCDGYLSRDTYDKVTIVDQDVDGLVWEVDVGATVKGRVLSKAGAPIEGASVWGHNVGGQARDKTQYASDTSQPDGSYELKGVKAGTLSIDVWSDRAIGPKDDWKVPVSAGAVVTQDLVLDDGGAIQGVVVDGEGKPVGGVRVRAAPVTGDFSGWNNGVRTKADGTFVIENLRAGDYRVTANRGWSNTLRKPGSNDDAKQGERVSVAATKTSNVKLVVESQSGSISGSVVDAAGAVVADAFVVAARESEAAGARRSTVAQTRWSADEKPVLTSTEGTFTIGALSPGNYTLRAFRKGGGEAVAEHVPVGGNAKLTIVATGSIAGVAKRAGKPIDELTIALVDAKTGFRRNETFFRTGGTFLLGDLPKGAFTLTASTEGGKHQLQLDLAEGEHKTGVEITLEQLVTLTGRVIDMVSKQPIAGMRMMASLGKGSGNFMIRSGDDDRPNISGDDGRFTIEDAPRGAVTLNGIPKNFDDENYGWFTVVREVAGSGTVDLGDVPVLKKRSKRGEPTGELGFKLVENPDGTDLDKRKFEIAFIDPKGPAANIGLAVGDVITSIDGFDVTGANYSNGWTLMRAPPGTKLALGLARGATVSLVLGQPQ